MPSGLMAIMMTVYFIPGSFVRRNSLIEGFRGTGESGWSLMFTRRLSGTASADVFVRFHDTRVIVSLTTSNAGADGAVGSTVCIYACTL